MNGSGIRGAWDRLIDAIEYRTYVARHRVAGARRRSHLLWAGMLEPTRERLWELRGTATRKFVNRGDGHITARRRREAAVALVASGAAIAAVFATTLGSDGPAEPSAVAEPAPPAGGATAPGEARDVDNDQSPDGSAALKRQRKPARTKAAPSAEAAPSDSAGTPAAARQPTDRRATRPDTPARRPTSDQTIRRVARRQPSAVSTPPRPAPTPPTPPTPAPAPQPQPAAPKPAKPPKPDGPPQSQAPAGDKAHGPKDGGAGADE